MEVDGGQHAESASDKIRTMYLNDHGYRILRFWNHDVLKSIEGVLHIITEAIGTHAPPDPNPPQERGEGS